MMIFFRAGCSVLFVFVFFPVGDLQFAGFRVRVGSFEATS